MIVEENIKLKFFKKVKLDIIKKFIINTPILCLVISIIIFFIFNNISFLHDLLGHLSVYYNFEKPSCTDGLYFCRPLFSNYLYYHLNKFLIVDLIIFLQLYFLIYATILIRFQLFNLNLNPWIVNFLFMIIIFNPKIIKYSFSTMEESFYLPVLLICISLLIKFIINKNLKSLIYLNFSLALLILIRPAGIVFYFIIIFINIYYIIKINRKIFSEKILFTFIFSLILISPFIINKFLDNYAVSVKKNNNYFGIHALSSLISKKTKITNNNDLSLFINNRISKLNKIHQIKKFNLVQKLHFECVIYPAMNIVIYNDPEIIDFLNQNYTEKLNKKLFIIYIKSLINNPTSYFFKFNKCFFANFLMSSILSKKEFEEIKRISIDPIFTDNDKEILNSLERNVKSYGNFIKPIRVINLFILLITILSVIISIISLLKNKNDKLAILSILFFCMYYLIINLHVNLNLVQTRWFFTYSPLLIFSNLKIIELINLFLIKYKKSF